MNSDLKAGTAGGTLLGLFYQVQLSDMLNTAFMAAIGAIISFCVSKGLQWLVRWSRKEKNKAT